MKTRRFIISAIALICTMGGAWASSIPGTLPGLFTINVSGEKVVFSQGNLQYQASTNTWRFAEHQYDYIGNVDGNTSPSSSQAEWIDYFNWGTSGYNHGANCYQPWSTSTSRSDYYAYGSNSKNLYDAKDDGTMRGQADWGYNAISNGGNAENIGWRTLTKEEWAYIINSRSGDYRYAKGTVHNKNGFIIFPDGFTLPEGISITNANTSDAGYTSYSDDDWAALETNGCVFLPATGMRNRTSVYETGSVGNYWSSSYMNNDRVYNIRFDGSSLKIENDGDRQNGFPVRLVKASLDQDNGGYYLIGCVQDWKDFATLVETTPMANAKMTADIDLSTDVTMVGTKSIPYQGTFDGQGHKLTVNWSVNGGGDGVAPFRYVSGATIQKLHVDGIISATGSDQRGAASIVAFSKGSTTTTINECWGSVSLTCYDTMGGLFSVAYETSTVNITDCLFSGTINPTHYGQGFCAGLASQAMKDGSNVPTINITRGLYLGKYTGSTENCYNFVRMDRPDLFGTHTITDCYYKDAYGTAQGTQVSTEQLADGTVTNGLNNGRTGDEAPWIQDPVTNLPMLKSFVSKNSGISTGFIPIENGKLEMENEANGWYSISGQKLKGKPTAKGIYIRKGKKVIIN